MYACLHVPNHPAALECAEEFSPLIERVTADTAILDISGLDLLMGSPRDIAKSMRGRSGELARVAVASNPDAALHAARGFEGVTVISPGREAEALAPLPLTLLTQDPRLLETFVHWGLRTFRDLAALPEEGLAERLGVEGVRLRMLVRGEASRPLRLDKDDSNFEESMELEHPLKLLEPLSFLLSRQLNDICARLQSHGLATSEVHLTLNTEKRTYRPPVPMRDARAFLKLMQLDLAGTPPREPVTRLSIKAETSDPRSVQSGLFLPPTPAMEKLEITVARIANIVGKTNVGIPEVLNTHRPDAFALRPTKYLATHERIGTQGRDGNALALRMYRPPKPLDLARVSHKIIRMAGPWRSCGDWWTSEPWNRDEYDVVLDNGALYRIYQDRKTRLWFFEGSYD
jgi:protein ImuB